MVIRVGAGASLRNRVRAQVITGGGPPPFVGPLDALGASNVRAAYGTRQLFAAYAGALVRIGRAAGGNEVDVFPTAAGELTGSSAVSPTTWGGTLSAYIANASGLNGGDGHVVTWYDQSGATGRDLNETTLSVQPLLVAAGSIITVPGGSRAAVRIGGGRAMRTALLGANVYSTGIGVHTVVGSNDGNAGAGGAARGVSTVQDGVSTDFASDATMFMHTSTGASTQGFAFQSGGSANRRSVAVTTTGVRSVMSNVSTGTNRYITDGTNTSTTYSTTNSFVIVRWAIGSRADTTYPAEGPATNVFYEALVIAEPANAVTWESSIRAALT